MRAGKVTRFAVHPGVYRDSLVLMQLQHRLLARPGVVEAGAAMASAANLELLAAGGLLPEGLPDLQAEDLLVVVRADDADNAEGALNALDELLATRAAVGGETYRPRGLDGALSQIPDARWALISVPGRYAARVTEDALDRGLNVFLYSDNVERNDERRLKRLAAERRLMVLGPDCGTAIVAGIGLGFANRVRHGPIGLVGGSGTGLQAVSVGIHALGGGISQAIGTGGRDLSSQVGGIATRQALQVLADDPGTRVVVLVSKSPSHAVAEGTLEWAAGCGKPTVVYLQGYEVTDSADGIYLAASLSEAAALAVRLGGTVAEPERPFPLASVADLPDSGPGSAGLVRGLFAGGTLAAEALLLLQDRIAPLFSNLDGPQSRQLDDVFSSQGHTVLDLGADAFTRGRLHPMIDQETRLKRLAEEAAERNVELILLDVVLGVGAHADPAAELAPAIEAAIGSASEVGRKLRVVVIVVGTTDDPQEIERQVERLDAAGATVVSTVEEAVRFAEPLASCEEPTEPMLRPKRVVEPERPVAQPPASIGVAPADAFAPPLAAINIGLESFHSSLVAQGATAIHVDWQPPAGGNEHLANILERLRTTRQAEVLR